MPFEIRRWSQENVYVGWRDHNGELHTVDLTEDRDMEEVRVTYTTDDKAECLVSTGMEGT